MSKIPEPWATRLVKRGYTDRRSPGTNAPSLGALAADLGVNTSTLSEAISGKRSPRPETIAALIDKLGDDVTQWLGVSHFQEWNPPADAALLTDAQREVLEALIRVMTTEREAGTQRAADAAEKTDEVGRRRSTPRPQEVPPIPAGLAADDPEVATEYTRRDEAEHGEDNEGR